MTEPYSKNLGEPDETIRFPGVAVDIVDLGDWTVGRSVHEAGWRWSKDVQPLVGGTSCQARHTGLILEGRLGVALDDGTNLEFGPDDVFHIPPGHDGWVVGDGPCVFVEWTGVRAFAGFRSSSQDRVLATLLVTDVIDSTGIAARLGDVAWRDTLSAHFEAARSELERFGGQEVKTTADGMLATFDGPARAVRFASALRRSAQRDGLRIRGGVHVGEVELVGRDVRGLAVHIASRILDAAEEDDILVSETTRALALASGLSFEERGSHSLKGVAEEVRLFAYLPEGEPPPS